MSSTNRGGKRHAHDYYVTPIRPIVDFLREWKRDQFDDKSQAELGNMLFFDPCAGGNSEAVRWEYKEDQLAIVPATPMSYPTAIRSAWSRTTETEVLTNDIREDSPAETHTDFLRWPALDSVDVVITNPPFAIAMEVIQHALDISKLGGWVVMLLRLNFFGSLKRKSFLQAVAPDRAYVHSERMSFMPDGGTDSIEYMHAVWRKGHPTRGTILRVI